MFCPPQRVLFTNVEFSFRSCWISLMDVYSILTGSLVRKGVWNPSTIELIENTANMLIAQTVEVIRTPWT